MKERFIGLGIVCSLVMILYIGILFKLQIIDQSQYKQQVDDIASRRNVLQSQRGRIFDRNEKALAYNVSRYQMIINPTKFLRTTENIEKVASLLDITPQIILNIIGTNSRQQKVVIRDNLSYENAITYIERTQNIQGISWKRIIQREYGSGATMAHVIGYVGDISASELQTFSYTGYYNLDVIGKIGVEKEYEELLRGRSGLSKEVVNVFGQKVKNSDFIEEEIEPGNDLILTLDYDIQQLVVDAIGDREGAAIVMRPVSGEILAMASYPSDNPNILVNSLNEKVLSDIQENNQFPFLNRAIQSAAPPASIFKVLMTLIYLAEDSHKSKGHWRRRIWDPGYVKIGNRIFRNWFRKGHGWQNYIDALKNSNNVFFYTIGVDTLGVSTISKYADVFGLGKLTGIDLPSEIKGIFPDADWKESRLGEVWTIGDTANMSIGQGFITTTPLQLAVMMSGIVNNGEIVKPYVLKEVRDQLSGETIYETKKEIINSVDINSSVFDAVKSAMRSVATDGTSSVIMNSRAVDIAGKTGSGQVIGDNFENLHSWYLAFGPYDAPLEEQVVVVVWIDAVNDWEWWGHKAANTIFQGIFANQNYDEAVESLKEEGAWWLYDSEI